MERAKNILAIQGRIDEKFIPEEQANLRAMAEQADVDLTFGNALSEDKTIPWHKPRALLQRYRGVIILGSSNFNLNEPSNLRDRYTNRVMPLVEEIFDNGEHGMGICMGHQAFAHAAGEKVHRIADRQENGTVQLTLTDDGEKDPVFAGLPSSIKMLYGHNHSVAALPDGFTRLGSTQQDPNSVLRRDNVVTLQGHPELTDENDFKLRLDASKQTPHPYEQTHPIEKPHPAIQTIIVNFFNHVKRSA